MSFAKVVIEPLARQDIREARDWYARKGEHLSVEFRNELVRNFDFISRVPLGTSIAFGHTRLKPMRQFPHLVGYVFHVGIVFITGVRHGSQDWDAFRERDFG